MKQLRYTLAAVLALGYLVYTQFGSQEVVDQEPIAAFAEIVDQAPPVTLGEVENLSPKAPVSNEESLSQSESILDDEARKAQAELANTETEIIELQQKFQEKRVYVPTSDLKDAKIERQIRKQVAKALAEGSIKPRDVKSYSSYLRRMAYEAALEEQSVPDDREDGAFFADSTLSSIE